MDRQGKYTSGHLSPEKIKQYLEGGLNHAEMHELELHLLDCEFCSDAVEGFELTTQSSINTEHTLHDLRNRLADRIKSHETDRKLLRWPAWSAAAGIALAIAGYVVIKYMELEEQKSPSSMVERIIAQLDVDNSDTLLIYVPRPDEMLAYNNSEIPASSGQSFSNARLSTVTHSDAEKPLNKLMDNGGNVEESNVQTAPTFAQESVTVTAYKPQKKQALAASVATIKLADTSEEKGLWVAENPPKTVLRGKVVSKDDGQPLPGVSLSITETGEGTTTDLNGNYKLITSADSANITISFIGFESETFQLNDTTQLAKIMLEPDQQGLNETVVVGYGKAVSRKASPVINAEEYERYLKNNLVYPQKALENKVEGKVVLRFTVSEDAELRGFNVLKSLGYGCDEEAIRLIKEGPKWNPTLDKGQTKRQRVTKTVTFSLPSGQ